MLVRRVCVCVCARVRNFSWESKVNSKRREIDYFNFLNMNREKKSYVISFVSGEFIDPPSFFPKHVEFSFSIFREWLYQHAQYSQKQINFHKITAWDCAVMIVNTHWTRIHRIHRNLFLSVVRNNVGQTGNVNISTVEGNKIVQQGMSVFTRGNWQTFTL